MIGAQLDDDRGTDSGSAYVFVRSGATWSEQAKLLPSDGAAGDFFGAAVSVSGDTAVIGAWSDDDRGEDSGSVYVFVRSGATWSQQAKLLARDGAAFDGFGLTVSVQGNSTVIGAPFDDDGGSYSGSAYIFARNGTTWSEQAKLSASDGAAYDTIGTSVSFNGDTAVIGANWDDDRGFDSGSAYVFVRTGMTWSKQTKLTASDGVAGDEFGLGVSMSGDTAVIAAPFGNGLGYDSGKGAACVFVRTGTMWFEQAKLTANDAAAGDGFGISSVSGDTAVIGSGGDDDLGVSSGSAYVFVRNGTMWSQARKLMASDGVSLQRFGSHVMISGDLVIIGAPGDGDHGNSAGATYVYDLSIGPTVPSAPQRLQWIPGDGQIILTWHRPSSDGGSAVVRYRVYRGTAPGTESFLAEIDNAAYADQGFSTGVTFYYQVSATNAAGEGPRSDEVAATLSGPDTTNPTLAILSPPAGATLTSFSVILSGTASDDVGVQRVEISADGTTWILATGTNTWSGTLTLREGANTIFARVTDTSGNVATETIHVSAQPTVMPAGIPGWVPFAALAIVVAVVEAAAIFLWSRRRSRRQPPQH